MQARASSLTSGSPDLLDCYLIARLEAAGLVSLEHDSPVPPQFPPTYPAPTPAQPLWQKWPVGGPRGVSLFEWVPTGENWRSVPVDVAFLAGPLDVLRASSMLVIKWTLGILPALLATPAPGVAAGPVVPSGAAHAILLLLREARNEVSCVEASVKLAADLARAFQPPLVHLRSLCHRCLGLTEGVRGARWIQERLVREVEHILTAGQTRVAAAESGVDQPARPVRDRRGLTGLTVDEVVEGRERRWVVGRGNPGQQVVLAVFSREGDAALFVSALESALDLPGFRGVLDR